jgi:predicted dienelactone hydrolase
MTAVRTFPRPGAPAAARAVLSLVPVLAVAVTLAISAAPANATGEPVNCSAGNRPACQYETPGDYDTATVDRVLVDPARNNHVVPIRIRYPIGATGPRPVVIWNHGGGVKSERPGGGWNFDSLEHSLLFSEAGYVTVLVDRTAARGVPNAAQLKACKANGVLTPAGCQGWLGFHVLGTTNTNFVLAQLALIPPSQLPGFGGSFDLTRVVIGGFSGGTEQVLNQTGAPQKWPGYKQASVHVPGVVAYVAAAPRGPMYAGYDSGFDNDAYESIGATPFLFLYARNEHGAEPGSVGGAARAPSWLGATPGGKVMSWDVKDAVTHVNLDLATCDESALQAAHCAWTASLTMAFLDAYVEHRQEAIDWLASDAYRILTAGEIELHRR